MILAFDSYYFENSAKTICLAFKNWSDIETQEIFTEILENVEEYRSGEFYKRELPCILSLFRKIRLKEIETIIVDGFVYLDDNNKFGLGGHLYKELEEKIPVIGVAKNDFMNIEKKKVELFRGESKKPLYITSIGIAIDKAAENIKSMSGKYRIPTLLKHLDSLTKNNYS
jgi:deoxyribonuclease V